MSVQESALERAIRERREALDELERLRAALALALNVIENINACHGCLDNGDERDRTTVADLRAALTKAPR